MQCIKLFIGYVYEAKDFYMRLCIGIRCLELEYPKKTVITLCMISSFIEHLNRIAEHVHGHRTGKFLYLFLDPTIPVLAIQDVP